MYDLIDEKTGKVMALGDKVATFRGEETTIESVLQPRNEFGHGGRVCTGLGHHFASVYGLKWKEAPNAIAV